MTRWLESFTDTGLRWYSGKGLCKHCCCLHNVVTIYNRALWRPRVEKGAAIPATPSPLLHPYLDPSLPENLSYVYVKKSCPRKVSVIRRGKRLVWSFLMESADL